MGIGSRQQRYDPVAVAFYREALLALQKHEVPFLVGGAFALEGYTVISRDSKDFDIFLRRRDFDAATDALRTIGCRVELTFPHWLGKAWKGDRFIDLVFNSGNGIVEVDDEWFEHSVPGEVFEVPVHLCPPEETIWGKAYVMERERYDGADVAHLLRACAARLDWDRLIARFGADWRVLAAHLVLFGFIYPGERTRVPARVLQEMTRRLVEEAEKPSRDVRLCRGTLLSRGQYLADIEAFGYEDARLAPRGNLGPEDLALWTAAIKD